jgi:hypothetical protein
VDVEVRVVLDGVDHAGDGGPVHVVDEVDEAEDDDGGGVGLVEVREPGKTRLRRRSSSRRRRRRRRLTRW